ncbi:MAG TPA: hypothetical protein VET25_08555, partial [Aestuariivirgaceae bacterium]|nr:hypothetical protein [Aestuariivirgaceae bacterium]
MPSSSETTDASRGASSIPRHSGELALAAILAAAIVTLYAVWTRNVVRTAAIAEGHHGVLLEVATWLGILAAAVLFWPASKALAGWQAKNRAVDTGNILSARINAAAA